MLGIEAQTWRGGGFLFFTAGIKPTLNENSFKVAPVSHGGGKSGGLMWAQCVLYPLRKGTN